jgi:hypothetical protein
MKYINYNNLNLIKEKIMKLKLLASFLLTANAVVKQAPRNSWYVISDGETAYTQVPESYKWKDL